MRKLLLIVAALVVIGAAGLGVVMDRDDKIYTVTEDDALVLALEAAELDWDEVMDVRVKSDTYGVKPVHYVAFTDKATGIRYSCEVNRRTGEIPTMGASQA